MSRYPLVEAKCGAGVGFGIGMGDEKGNEEEELEGGAAGKRLMGEQMAAGGEGGSGPVGAAGGGGAGGGVRAVFSVTHKHNITIAINDEPVDKIRMKCTSPLCEEPPRYGKWRCLDVCRTPVAALSLNLLALILGAVAPSASARAAIVWLSSLACSSSPTSSNPNLNQSSHAATQLAHVLLVLLAAAFAVTSALTPLLVRRTSLKLVLLTSALLLPLSQLPMLSAAPLCLAPGALLVGAALGPLALSARLYLAAFERVYRSVFRANPRTLAVAVAFAHAALSAEHLLANLLFYAILPSPKRTPAHSTTAGGSALDTLSIEYSYSRTKQAAAPCSGFGCSGAVSADDEFGSTANGDGSHDTFSNRLELPLRTTRFGSPLGTTSSSASDPLLSTRCSKDAEGTRKEQFSEEPRKNTEEHPKIE